jgi:spermidine/putrescine transport system substrate-binding protein
MRIWSKISLMALLCIFSSCGRDSGPTLHLFIWADTIKPELLDAFEDKYHCNVSVDTFDSNESMYAKLQLSSARYDLIFPSSYFVEILSKQNMIQPLDLSLIPNSANLDPRYMSKVTPSVAVPFLVSFSGIAYRKDKITDIELSWRVFGRKDLKGRMTMLNDAREAIGAGLRTLDFSVNTRSGDEISMAADLLIEWKKNLAKFDNEQYRHGIASGEFLVIQGYSIDVMQVKEENPHVAFLYPHEGAIASVDSLAIPKQAQHAELAHAFINFMLEPQNALQNVLYTNGLVPLPEIYEELQRNEQRKEILFPTAEALQRMETIKDLGADVELYYKAWDRIKNS